MSTTVGLISLGCAKNLIDSEVMIGHLAQPREMRPTVVDMRKGR